MIKNLTSNIRIATLHDAEAIALVHLRSWQEMYKEFIPESILMNLSLKERTQQWFDLIKQGVNVLVFEIDNQMVGFVSICAFRDNNADSVTGEISAIYIHPEYWRKGFGAQLCRIAISELESQGYKKVVLWVLEGNIQARKFYEALGFEATSSTKLEEFYESGALLTDILYQKIL
ncbi:GNAT family N-acetyltransferase [Legionella fallonii]|uniref:Putative GCN5-related N-acetyltransferase n=1 Tax=Legionella fallonii LLAP-10 TaxID=1212491 RepID=A0A098GB73_9GAMM|nr:GNAT family N-acetyltransferase [Legionella fallonii]CEG58721.1 Putative GCN5-related N-acetyltransferase [Legionella fallonii LLAP-10]